MAALVNGCYELFPIPDPSLGPRKIDMASTYDTDRYPHVREQAEATGVPQSRFVKTTSNEHRFAIATRQIKTRTGSPCQRTQPYTAAGGATCTAG
jgi:hypothetical protein